MGVYCENSTEQTLSSSYQTNFNGILSWLTSDARTSKGYNYAISTGAAANDTVYCLYDCQGDVDRSFCQFCLSASTNELVRRCPNSVSAIIWYDFCFIQYSNQNFISNFSTTLFRYDILGRKNISNPTGVNATENYMRSLIRIATMTSQLNDMGEFSLSNGEKRYGLVQCTRYLGDDKCAQCLEDLLERVHERCAKKIRMAVCTVFGDHVRESS
ncbi:hypothetical protein L6164_023212 [Bauhinia variegata]|uniref:Uncharacterized protein n=1 Tax=Bauhinia variegata TaxID=167791 RepID=A0ACB9MJF9_BAUVA|nr:hypothetical protein L6164_023212 [Bauhinia variegata]